MSVWYHVLLLISSLWPVKDQIINYIPNIHKTLAFVHHVTMAVPYTHIHTVNSCDEGAWVEWTTVPKQRPPSSIIGGLTLPIAWAPSPVTFNDMPVTTAMCPSASKVVSRHWLVFLRASFTIDVISDSQPWMWGRERNVSLSIESAQTNWYTGSVHIYLIVNQCKQESTTANKVWRGSK